MHKVAFVLFLITGWVMANDGVSWRYVASMPHGRSRHAAVLTRDGHIHVLGGHAYLLEKKRNSEGMELIKIKNTIMNSIYSHLEYEPQQNRWYYKVPADGNKYSIFGMYLWDIRNGDWVSCGRKDGVQTFYSCQKCKKYIDELDSTQPTFGIVLGHIPEYYRVLKGDLTNQGCGVAAALDPQGKIVWTGGSDTIGFMHGQVHEFDPATDRWTPWLEDVSVKEAEAFRAMVAKIPALSKGEWEKLKEYRKVNMSDVEQRDSFYTKYPRLLERKQNHELVSMDDGRLFSFGGFKQGGRYNSAGKVVIKQDFETVDTVECFDPRFNLWRLKTPIPRPRTLTAAVRVGTLIFLFGGVDAFPRHDVRGLDTVLVYDTEKDSWSSRRPMPQRRCGHDAVLAADGKVWVLGGTMDCDSPSLRSVLIYDPRTDTWENGPDMLLARDALAAVATPDGKIYAIGGNDAGAYPQERQSGGWFDDDESPPVGPSLDSAEVLDVLQWRKSRKK